VATVKEITLRPSDEIALGDYRLRFEEPDVRGVAKHDTCQLPKSVAQELTQSAYSGTATGLTPFEKIPLPDAARRRGTFASAFPPSSEKTGFSPSFIASVACSASSHGGRYRASCSRPGPRS